MLQRLFVASGFCLSMTLGSLSGFAQSELVPSPTPQQTSTARFHSGWAALQPDGSLLGRAVMLGGAGNVSPQPSARVTLSRNLIPLATTQADADGNFAFAGLSQGIYEIASETDHSFAIVSFEAVSGRQPSVMDVYASSMPRTAVDAVLKELWAPQEEGAGTPKFEDVMAPMIPGTQSQRVAIRAGKINGQVAFADSRNVPEAHVVKAYSQGNLIDSAPVDSQGKFILTVGNPGPIDVVLGGAAYAILGFEAVEVENLAKVSGGKSLQLVSMQEQIGSLGVCDSLVVPAVGCGIALPPPVIVEEGLPLAACAPPAAAPMCGGFSPCAGGYRGGGFSGGGGGYGGGGFGGIGGLLGIGGIALGAAALIDNNDNNNRDNGFRPPLATPFYGYPYYY